MPGGALTRGERGVMFLDHLRSLSLLGEQFLLRQQLVGEDTVQIPDFIELVQFRGGVVAQGSRPVHGPGPSSSVPRARRCFCCRAGSG
jgi:hypothetical protein